MLASPRESHRRSSRKPGGLRRGRWLGLALAAIAASGAYYTLAGGRAGEGTLPRSSSENRSVGSVSSGASSPERLRIRVLREFGHDITAYTQGLVWDEGSLVESTGRYGESHLRRWRPSTQDAVSEVSLPSHFFGEGLAVVGERLIQPHLARGSSFGLGS